MPPRRVRRRAVRKAVRRARRAGPTRSLRSNYQVATLVETIDPQIVLVENIPYYQQVYLQSFKRAIQMSNLYEQFRIEEVKWTYSPLFNTFQEGPGESSVPQMYNVMDRLESLNAAVTTLTDLTQMGAQRRRFDKPITIRYKPNTMVMTGASNPGVATAQILQISGADYGRWFPCVTQNIGVQQENTPNTLSAHTQYYNGHWVYFEQQQANPNTNCCSIAVTIRVSFKNPCVNETPVPNPVLPLPIKVGHPEVRVYKVLDQYNGPTGPTGPSG